ncbi:hypothetical protein GCM10022285_22290 [Streptomyces tunisiensis]|uniref:Uncharacterized protein n=1 Tax=Streptomyces tunisiensis TaxID=948699 RepID=A0ABP7Y7Y6_9ACTN
METGQPFVMPGLFGNTWEHGALSAARFGPYLPSRACIVPRPKKSGNLAGVAGAATNATALFAR